jgi:hypothetical protein
MMHAESGPIHQLDLRQCVCCHSWPHSQPKSNGPGKMHLALVITEPDPLLTTIRPVSEITRGHGMKTAT